MSAVRISEYTSFDEVEAWKSRTGGGAIEFVVSAKSGFGPGVEGVAVGALHELQQCGPIAVTCSSDSKDTKLFDSVFGVALCLGASALKTPSGEQQSRVAQHLWTSVNDSQGFVGTGNRRGLVFRDPDCSLPVCLRANVPQFPTRAQFRYALEGEAKKMGLQRGFSKTEEDLVTFLYEAAQNSHEHGRTREDGRALVGLRGIVMERINIASRQAMESRTDLAPFQRDSIQRMFGSSAHAPNIFAFTVCDLGPGIHRTLPEKSGETEWDRLGRAFSAGESRKQVGFGLEAGQGLAKLKSGVERLRALLYVKSGALSGFMDFSRPDSNSGLSALSANQCASGSSLTLMWRDRDSGGDQGVMFE